MNATSLAALALSLTAAALSAQQPGAFKTPQDKLSYAIGVDMARNFKRQGVQFNPEWVAKGLKDSLSGDRLALTEQDLRQTLVALQAEVMQKERFKRRAGAQDNSAVGQAFLAANRTNNGVVTLPSGLQYKILAAGQGKRPAETNIVQCHYRGTLLDGAEFYASTPDKPGTFKVKDAPVAAWRGVLPLMTAGSKWRLFSPPHLAYGEQGVGRNVGRNETVIFDLELLAVK